jgi:virginiamycin B lyase
MSYRTDMRGVAVVLVVACLGILGAGAGGAWAAEARPAEVAVPGGYVGPLTWGPGDALWFVGNDGIGRRAADGTVTERKLSSPIALADAIAAGPGGVVWVTSGGELGEAEIDRIAADGKVTRVALPGYEEAGRIAVDGEGNAWFTIWGPRFVRDETFGKAWIGRLTPAGKLTRFALPGNPKRRDEGPGTIVAGPGGRMWFTDPALRKIGSISASGKIVEHSAPVPAEGLAPTADGGLWFTGFGGIGTIDAHGKVRLLTTAGNEGDEITSGMDGPAAVDSSGNLWFIDQKGWTERVTPSGQLSWVGLPRLQKATGIVAGPEGSIWEATGSGSAAENPSPLVRFAPGIPSVEVSHLTTAVARGGKLSVPLDCSGSGRACRGNVELALDRKRIARAHFEVPARGSGAATVRLPGPVRGKLARAGYLRIEVGVNAEGGIDDQGAITVRTAAPPRPRRGHPILLPLPEGAPPGSLARGPGSALWMGGGVGHFTKVSPDGTMTSVEVPGLAAEPTALASDSHGDIWFLEVAGRGFYSGNELQPIVGRLGADGQLTQFHLPPGPEEIAEQIAVGADGAAWVARSAGRKHGEIDRIGPGGKIRRFRIHGAAPWYSIVAARGGGVWLSRAGGGIGRLSATGKLRSFGAGGGGEIEAMALAPSGDLWFGRSRGALGRLTPTGQIAEYATGFGGFFESLVAAPGGEVCFGLSLPGRLGCVDPQGKVTAGRRGGAAAGPGAVGPDGSVWFAGFEQSTLAILRPGRPHRAGRRGAS